MIEPVPYAAWVEEVSRYTVNYDPSTGVIASIFGVFRGKQRRLEIPQEMADRKHPRNR